MKIPVRASLVIGILFASTAGASAGDIVNGWSDVSSIQQVRSLWSGTDVLLTASQAGCGTSDPTSWWHLPFTNSDAGRLKQSALLGAYLAGKRVQLRCESSAVTDFVVQS